MESTLIPFYRAKHVVVGAVNVFAVIIVVVVNSFEGGMHVVVTVSCVPPKFY